MFLSRERSEVAFLIKMFLNVTVFQKGSDALIRLMTLLLPIRSGTATDNATFLRGRSAPL
jgi:hypothetical protein